MTRAAQLFERAAAHHQAGRFDEAERDYLETLKADERDADALRLLAALYVQTNRPQRAVEFFERAHRAQPRNAETLNNLGVALRNAGRLEEAAARYEQALAIDPHYAQARANLANACHERGNALIASNKLDAAAACFEKTLQLDPNHHRALNNLGNLRRTNEDMEAAAALYRRALAAKPDYAEAHVNLGTALRDMGRLEEAERSYRQALRLKPDDVDISLNLGTLLQQMNRHEEAVAIYDEILRRAPDNAEVEWNKSLALLALGDYAQGWKLHEFGFPCGKRGFIPFQTRRWDGREFPGRLLIWGEQGIGDHLQFVRYAALCKPRCGEVLVHARDTLTKLLRNCPTIDRVLTSSSEQDFDFQISMMSLPYIFGTTLETVPAAMPYLFVDKETRKKWAPKFAGAGGFKIGLVWAGNARAGQIDAHLIDKRRSLHLSMLMPLIENFSVDVPVGVPLPLREGSGEGLAQQETGFLLRDDPSPAKTKDLLTQVQVFATSPARGEERVGEPPQENFRHCRFYSLQMGDAAGQIDECGLRGRIEDFMPEAGDFLDTAAIVKNLDLVISVDTSVAHLAGALGKPVWILSRYDACWRWLRNREFNPWYPTARVFGQPAPGAWEKVIEKVCDALLTAKQM